jgi:hypothetical protein
MLAKLLIIYMTQEQKHLDILKKGHKIINWEIFSSNRLILLKENTKLTF